MQPGFEMELTGRGELTVRVFHSDADPSQTAPFVQTAEGGGGTVVLLGELHYRDDLLARLDRSDRSPGMSDAELILAMYQRFGRSAIEQLEGEFSIAIFDPADSSVVALRDPTGSWPLFCAVEPGRVRVATSLRYLAPDGRNGGINLDFLGSFLMMPFAFFEMPTEETVIAGVRRVLPGDAHRLSADGTAQRLRSWDWMGNLRDLTGITLEESAEEYRRLLFDAVRQRLRRGAAAAHLSGGLDSSSIACVARRLIAGGAGTGPLTTLSLAYHLRSLAPETEYMQMVIDQGGPIDPHLLYADDLVDYDFPLSKFPAHDEPFQGFCKMSVEHLMLRAARQTGVSTILTGGGAEVTSEAHQYHLADWLRRGRLLATLQESRRWAAAKNQSPWSVLHRSAIQPILPTALRNGVGTMLRGGFGRWPDLGVGAIPPWVRKPFAREHHLWQQGLRLARATRKYPMERSMHELGIRLAGGNWANCNVTSPHGVRISHPFLDPRLVRFGLAVPTHIRDVPGMNKPLLQECMKGLLPEKLRTRSFKSSGNDTYGKGFSRNLRHLEALVTDSPIRELEIFDENVLLDAMREHAVGIGNARAGGRIQSTLAVILWYDRFVSQGWNRQSRLCNVTTRVSLRIRRCQGADPTPSA